MILFALSTLALFVASGLIVAVAAKSAPVGYQNEEGFQMGLAPAPVAATPSTTDLTPAALRRKHRRAGARPELNPLSC